MGEERLALRGFPLFFLIIPFEAHLSSCGAGPGGPPTSWCPPFSGANAAEAQHHNPTRPRLLRIFPLFGLSFHPPLSPFLPPTLPPLPSIDSRSLATLSSAILCLQLLCFHSEPPVSRHQKRIRLCRPSTKHKHYHLLQKPYVRRGDNRREESLWRAPRSGEL